RRRSEVWGGGYLIFFAAVGKRLLLLARSDGLPRDGFTREKAARAGSSQRARTVGRGHRRAPRWTPSTAAELGSRGAEASRARSAGARGTRRAVEEEGQARGAREKPRSPRATPPREPSRGAPARPVLDRRPSRRS